MNSSSVKSDRPVILVAEDDPMAADLLRSLLELRGLLMDLAGTGVEAVERWENGDYALIIMDLQMPRMDGLTAARIIREKERERGGYTPILAMSAHAYPEDQERCRAAGIDTCLKKPLDLNKGMETVLRLLQEAVPAGVNRIAGS